MGRPPKKIKIEDMGQEDQDRYRKALADYEGPGRHTQLNTDPKYSYYLAAKDEKYPSHPQNVSALTELGYEVVGPENNSGEQMPFGTVKSPDAGAVQTPEHVLMRIPKELREARDAKQHELGEARVAQSQEELQETMSKLQDVRSGSGRRYFVFNGPGRTSVSSD